MADSCIRGTRMSEQIMKHNDKECDSRCPAIKELRQIFIAHWLQNIPTKDLFLVADTVSLARERDPSIDPKNWGKKDSDEDS